MKVVVRHSPGAGGHFVTALAHTLLMPIDLRVSETGSAHNHNVYSSHNYDALAHGSIVTRDPNMMKQFEHYTQEDYHQAHPDATDGIQWFKDHLKFNSKGILTAYGKEWHFVRTHARVLDSLLPAIGDDARLINITIADTDIDQLSYNFVIKTILPNSNWAKERADDCLIPLHYWYPNKHVAIAQLEEAVLNKDVKFLNWAIKYAWLKSWEKYQRYIPEQAFNISWQEILDRSIVNRLDKLAEFLGITLDGYAKHNAVEFINNYVAAQTTVPYTLSIDDY